MLRSTFFGIEIGKRGLLTQRAGTDIVGHNLTNSATPGYSRQDPRLVTSTPFAPPGIGPYDWPGQLGTGPQVAAVTRAQNHFISTQIRAATSREERLGVLQDTYGQLETVFGEPSDVSMDALVTAFFATWHDLSLAPEETANRTALREVSQSLVEEFHRVDRILTDIRNDLDAKVQSMVERVNVLGRELAELNNKIMRVTGSGQLPNDMMDRRDQICLELSALVKIKVEVQLDESALVTIAGRVFVQEDEFRGLYARVDPDNDGYHRVVYDDLRNVDVPVVGGELMAVLEARDDVVPQYAAMVDSIAENLVTEVNAIHVVGYGLDKLSGRDFFEGTDAKSIDLTVQVKRDPRAIQAGVVDEPGDGRNALAIAQLRQVAVLGLDETTFTAFYRSAISDLGASADGVNRAMESQIQLQAQLDAMREAEIGVNMDEELVDLIRYEQGYAAASRVITTVDQTLDRLINATGLVGLQ